MKQLIIFLLLAIPMLGRAENVPADSVDSTNIENVKANTGADTKKWFGVSAGYVKKTWDYGNFKQGAFDRTRENFNGLQIGLRFTPNIYKGFGINTGIFFEYFYDYYDVDKDYQGDGAKLFLTAHESSLYIPLHLNYSYRLSNLVWISAYGGVSVDHRFSGHKHWRFHGVDKSVAVENLPYKDDNFSYEYGVAVRVWKIQADIWASRGITSLTKGHAHPVKCNKILNISASYFF